MGSDGLIADRRLYLSADRETVMEDGNVAAAYLFATEGTEIAAGDVSRLGLKMVGGKIVLPGSAEPDAPAAPEPEADEPEPEAKEAPKPERRPTRKRGG